MPNHVRNVVKFKNLKPEDINIILDMIASPIMKREPSETTRYTIDFNKIIPEPEEKEDCPKEYIIGEHSPIVPDEKRPWFNWYDWHLAFWGTKWDAYDSYTKIGKSYITFVFSTAWSYPQPIIHKLTILGYDIDMLFADEDYGHNCGKITYTNEQGWNEYYESSHSVNPARFAQYVWNNY